MINKLDRTPFDVRNSIPKTVGRLQKRAISKMEKTFDDAANDIEAAAEEVFRAIKKFFGLGKKKSRVIKSFEKVTVTVANKAGEAAKTVVAAVDPKRGLENQVENLNKDIKAVNGQLGEIISELGSFNRSLNRLESEEIRLAEQLDTLGKRQGETKKGISELKEQLLQTKRNVQRALSEFNNSVSTLAKEKAAEALDNAPIFKEKAQKEAQEIRAALTEKRNNIQSPQRRLERRISELEAREKQIRADMKTKTEEIAANAELLKNAKAKVGKLKTEQKQLEGQLNSLKTQLKTAKEALAKS